MSEADAPESRITICDIEVKVAKLPLRKGTKERDRTQQDFRVRYTLKLSEKCHNKQNKLTVNSTKAVWVDTDGNERCQDMRALEMKRLTMAVLERHKNHAKDNGVPCHLDYEADPGALPRSDMMWRCLWAYAESEVKKQLMTTKAHPLSPPSPPPPPASFVATLSPHPTLQSDRYQTRLAAQGISPAATQGILSCSSGDGHETHYFVLAIDELESIVDDRRVFFNIIYWTPWFGSVDDYSEARPNYPISHIVRDLWGPFYPYRRGEWVDKPIRRS